MKKLSEISVVTVLLVVSAMLFVPAEASDTHYSEDFTTTIYKDAVNTTACWDTVTGELKLPPFGVQLVGSLGTPADALGVAIHGDHAFVGLAGHPAFLVMDISNPESPTIVTTLDLPAYGGPVKIAGNYAYVACAPGALLQVVDITDPTSPFIAGSCTNMSRCRDIVIAGDFAYIAAGFNGLVVVDISDPTNPTKISSAGCFHYCYVISIAGNYVFLSDEAHGLDVYDISDPYNPVMVGDYQPPGGIPIGHNEVSGDYAFITGRYIGPDSDLMVLDITNPANPVLIGALETSGYVGGEISICGDILYTSDRTGTTSRLLVIDVSDPANPTLLDSYEYETATASHYFTPFGEYGFIGAGELGVQVLRIAEPVLLPVPTGHVSMSGRSITVKVHGDYAYLGVYLGNQGIQVIDISDPTNLDHVGSCSTPEGVPDIHIEGDYAYIPTGSGIAVYDISNPISPIHVGTCNTPNSAYGLDIAGDYAFVADNPGFQVIDIKDPHNPILVGGCGTSGDNHEVLVAGNYAYMSGLTAGLEVIDISNPISPVYVGSFPSGCAYEVAISGNYVYMATSDAGLQVYDISNPLSPIMVGVYDPGSRVIDVVLSGDYAYCACWSSGFHVVDISDPTNPAVVGVFNTPDVAHGVDVAGDYVYLADNNYGMYAMRVFQRTFDTASGTGRSLAVNALKREIAEVQLNTTEVGTIVWSVSADNGVHWEPIVPGAGWHSFIHVGSELMWKSQHVYDITQPAVNPTCSFLEMEWVYSHIEVGFDIKPGSCPNPFNVKDDSDEDNKGKGPNKEYAKSRKGGVLPAAIVGSDELDVSEIDVSTILLEGIAPISHNYEDVTRPVEDGGECACTGMGSDGHLDLTLKFRRIALADVLGSLGHGEVVELTITGKLLDGTSFEGSDCVTIVGKRSSMPKFEEIEVVELGPPVPNPFNPMTRISYSVPNACAVSLDIFDSSGKLIIRLLDNVTVSRGVHTVEWRGVDRYGRAVDSGVYFCRLIAGKELITTKLVLLR